MATRPRDPIGPRGHSGHVLARRRRSTRSVIALLIAPLGALLAFALPSHGTDSPSAPFGGGAGEPFPSPPAALLAVATGAADAYLASQSIAKPHLLTVIDYSLPSTAPRLWLLDRTDGDRVLYHGLVAHGRNSGENHATRFSNQEGTLTSSLGLFLTEESYVGRNGYSLRLRGLEPGFNDRARERNLVIHGAWYVSAAFAREHGRLGRSWGCPALEPAAATAVIDRIRDGSLLFVYAPDPSWLGGSPYLPTTAAAPTVEPATVVATTATSGRR